MKSKQNTILEVLDCNQDDIRELKPTAKIRLSDGVNEYRLLSIYSSKDGNTLWFDIEPWSHKKQTKPRVAA